MRPAGRLDRVGSKGPGTSPPPTGLEELPAPAPGAESAQPGASTMRKRPVRARRIGPFAVPGKDPRSEARLRPRIEILEDRVNPSRLSFSATSDTPLQLRAEAGVLEVVDAATIDPLRPTSGDVLAAMRLDAIDDGAWIHS